MTQRTLPASAALALIALNTVVALVLGMMLDPILDPAMSWLMFGVLCVVALSEIIVVRLVIDANLAAVERGDAETSIDTAAATLTTLVSTFAVAPSVYGMVCAVLTGSPWPAIPLSAIGVLLLALNSQYASTRIDAARRELSMRGAA
jgi:hypothetical protein